MSETLLIQDLKKEVNWIKELIKIRWGILHEGLTSESALQHRPPDFSKSRSVYSELLQKYKLTVMDRLFFGLGMLIYEDHSAVEKFFVANKGRPEDWGFIQSPLGFIPTGETAIFVLAGKDLGLQERISVQMKRESRLLETGLVSWNEMTGKSFILIPDQFMEILSITALGEAKYAMSSLPLEGMYLDNVNTSKLLKPQLDRLSEELKKSASNKAVRGFRVHVRTVPGIGKVFDFAKQLRNSDFLFYHINTGKFIGETEKNLERLRSLSKDSNVVLFFDEADALFGKRTNVRDSHDRFANQEIAYLKSIFDDFPGTIIFSEPNDELLLFFGKEAFNHTISY
jgi:hypothetical protein